MAYRDLARDRGGDLCRLLAVCGPLTMHGSWPFNLTRDRGMRIVIDLERAPDDPGKRADVYYALRTLANNGMIESLEWDRGANVSKMNSREKKP